MNIFNEHTMTLKSDNQISLRFNKDGSFSELPSDLDSELKRQQDTNLRLLNLNQNSESISSIQYEEHKHNSNNQSKSHNSKISPPTKISEPISAKKNSPLSHLQTPEKINENSPLSLKPIMISKKLEVPDFQEDVSFNQNKNEDSIKTIKFQTQSKQKNSLKKKKPLNKFKLRLAQKSFIPTQNVMQIKKKQIFNPSCQMINQMINNPMFPMNQNPPYFGANIYNPMIPLNMSKPFYSIIKVLIWFMLGFISFLNLIEPFWTHLDTPKM